MAMEIILYNNITGNHQYDQPLMRADTFDAMIDFYSRILINQFEEVETVLRNKWWGTPVSDFVVKNSLSIKLTLLGLHYYTHDRHGKNDFKRNLNSNIAYEIHKIVSKAIVDSNDIQKPSLYDVVKFYDVSREDLIVRYTKLKAPEAEVDIQSPQRIVLKVEDAYWDVIKKAASAWKEIIVNGNISYLAKMMLSGDIDTWYFKKNNETIQQKHQEVVNKLNPITQKIQELINSPESRSKKNHIDNSCIDLSVCSFLKKKEASNCEHSP